ncbi:GAF domain-containing protein [Fontibacter flavus]|uniref:GAF domain-containing protein n=1 Tax=Fontibacter flavus TaxID=654838 RepID=A0ABV6FPV0_9BACT|nr:GAF domain-containing protein [Cyclobacteriaceae bacterium]
MAESIYIPESATKAEKYQAILPQVESLISTETDSYANLANVAAVLKETFGFFWVGFYLVKEDQLVLGPFQGPLACTRIAFGKGVCGTAWKEAQTQLVPDVDAFPGHIACSSASKSEVVVPGFKEEKVWIVLDVDSDRLDDFDQVDAEQLEKLMHIVSKYC